MPFPQKDEVLHYIADSKEPQTKRDLVRAFSIRGDDRRLLKDILRELEAEGKIIKNDKQGFSVPNALPLVTLIRVTGTDIDGDIFAVPQYWDSESRGAPPRIELICNTPLKEGDTALARLKRLTDHLYEGKVIRRIDQQHVRVFGQIVKTPKGYLLKPTDKKAKYDFDLSETDLNGAKPDDLAVCEILDSRTMRNRKVRVLEVIGNRGDINAISLIAIHEAGLHEEFFEKVLKETEGLNVPPLDSKDGKREDIRAIPLVTIDGADARDFDDAVFAEPLEDGGFHLIVAIADVAHYVRPGSQLDHEAFRRGNSTYFPDRVVPMLPEALSNDLCSLRPNEDRACLGFHLWIDSHGNLTKHKLFRGLMRSHARLTYEAVQVMFDHQEGDFLAMINPLYAAYAALDKAREQRGALDLDLPERQIVIEKGKMIGVKNRDRLAAHKLIEEFMILANVAAAIALEAKHAPCVYRIHDRPQITKLDEAREFVEGFGLSLPKTGIAQPAQINHILKKAAETDYSHLISMVILRTQSQAVYHPQNIGHFGLALTRYAHFTSPIRRYADLLVHRSLIRAYGLGAGGLTQDEAATLEDKAEHISQTERQSADAERRAVDRFTAAWMAERIGAQFTGKINGVTRFGLFITLDENGADGLVPIRTLPDDYYIHDEKQHALIGRKSKRLYRLGAKVTVSLVEADGLTGSSIFALVGTDSAELKGVTFKKTKNFEKPQKFDKKRGKKS